VRTVVGTGAPEMNPLVNPGAISAPAWSRARAPTRCGRRSSASTTTFAGRSLSVLQDVYKSEADTNQRNQAIGALMLAYGYIKDNWQQAVDLYTRQCSIGVNARTSRRWPRRCRRRQNPGHRQAGDGRGQGPGVLAVMATGGLYDDSGKWLYHTGLPAKSGVGGDSSPSHLASSGSRSCRRRSMTRATVSVRNGPSR
jgi:glutaminase